MIGKAHSGLRSGPPCAAIDVWLYAGLLARRGVGKVPIGQGFRGTTKHARNLRRRDGKGNTRAIRSWWPEAAGPAT